MMGYIHLSPDGDGRMARFLMNAMLASGGIPDGNPWRGSADNLDALESVKFGGDIRPFAAYIAERVQWSIAQAG